jgi:amino acid transporter
MSSMVPLGGGQYRFVSAFAPRRHERLLSYVSGWICSVGWQTRFTAHCYIIANMGQALIDLSAKPTGTSTWFFHLTVIMVAVVLSCFNAFAAGHLSIAEGLFAICHVFVLVPILVSLWVLADKGSSKTVFLSFTDNGGDWGSTGLSVCIGQLTSMFIVLGSDAMAYISEEVEEAEYIVPSSMVWSYLASMPMTLALLVTWIYNIGNLADVVKSPHPLVYVFETMLDSRNATIGLFTHCIGFGFELTRLQHFPSS